MLSGLVSKVRGAIADSHGATAVEYAIMAGFIAVVIVAGVMLFGTSVRGLFELVPPGL